MRTKIEYSDLERLDLSVVTETIGRAFSIEKHDLSPSLFYDYPTCREWKENPYKYLVSLVQQTIPTTIYDYDLEWCDRRDEWKVLAKDMDVVECFSQGKKGFVPSRDKIFIITIRVRVAECSSDWNYKSTSNNIRAIPVSSTNNNIRAIRNPSIANPYKKQKVLVERAVSDEGHNRNNNSTSLVQVSSQRTPSSSYSTQNVPTSHLKSSTVYSTPHVDTPNASNGGVINNENAPHSVPRHVLPRHVLPRQVNGQSYSTQNVPPSRLKDAPPVYPTPSAPHLVQGQVTPIQPNNSLPGHSMITPPNRNTNYHTSSHHRPASALVAYNSNGTSNGFGVHHHPSHAMVTYNGNENGHHHRPATALVAYANNGTDNGNGFGVHHHPSRAIVTYNGNENAQFQQQLQEQQRRNHEELLQQQQQWQQQQKQWQQQQQEDQRRYQEEQQRRYQEQQQRDREERRRYQEEQQEQQRRYQEQLQEQQQRDREQQQRDREEQELRLELLQQQIQQASRVAVQPINHQPPNQVGETSISTTNNRSSTNRNNDLTNNEDEKDDLELLQQQVQQASRVAVQPINHQPPNQVGETSISTTNNRSSTNRNNDLTNNEDEEDDDDDDDEKKKKGKKGEIQEDDPIINPHRRHDDDDDDDDDFDNGDGRNSPQEHDTFFYLFDETNVNNDYNNVQGDHQHKKEDESNGEDTNDEDSKDTNDEDSKDNNDEDNENGNYQPQNGNDIYKETEHICTTRNCRKQSIRLMISREIDTPLVNGQYLSCLECHHDHRYNKADHSAKKCQKFRDVFQKQNNNLYPCSLQQDKIVPNHSRYNSGVLVTKSTKHGECVGCIHKDCTKPLVYCEFCDIAIGTLQYKKKHQYCTDEKKHSYKKTSPEEIVVILEKCDKLNWNYNSKKMKSYMKEIDKRRHQLESYRKKKTFYLQKVIDKQEMSQLQDQYPRMEFIMREASLGVNFVIPFDADLQKCNDRRYPLSKGAYLFCLQILGKTDLTDDEWEDWGMQLIEETDNIILSDYCILNRNSIIRKIFDKDEMKAWDRLKHEYGIHPCMEWDPSDPRLQLREDDCNCVGINTVIFPIMRQAAENICNNSDKELPGKKNGIRNVDLVHRNGDGSIRRIKSDPTSAPVFADLSIQVTAISNLVNMHNMYAGMTLPKMQEIFRTGDKSPIHIACHNCRSTRSCMIHHQCLTDDINARDKTTHRKISEEMMNHFHLPYEEKIEKYIEIINFYFQDRQEDRYDHFMACF